MPSNANRAALYDQFEDERPFDLVRDTVVELGLPLVRIEQRRRGLEELFQ